ncbi:hypothetical protein [Streptomyces huasconensis]|uniref:hypothetical protein n=1 Tax=Streptomyces huasconensis TaxID=1854574 RepID=UPI0033F43737
MTYLVYVYNHVGGPNFPLNNATFPGYASQLQQGYPGWYLVGVGENQNFHAEAYGFHPGLVYNTDQVNPEAFYFYFALQPIGYNQPAPERELLGRAAKHHANPGERLPE